MKIRSAEFVEEINGLLPVIPNFDVESKCFELFPNKLLGYWIVLGDKDAFTCEGELARVGDGQCRAELWAHG